MPIDDELLRRAKAHAALGEPTRLAIDDELLRRAKAHAALGEPTRLAIVDELGASDRSPGELARRLHITGNLLAHHLDVLEDAGLIERFVSSGDRRRRYVRLHRTGDADQPVTGRPGTVNDVSNVLFVCTHNSARSQIAAALWNDRHGGGRATSAGTHPAIRVHPEAVRAAARRDLDLTHAVPVCLDADALRAAGLIVTVCDRAHEELEPGDDWLHWSIPDPVASGTPAAFDRAVADIEARLDHDLAAPRSTPTSGADPHPHPEQGTDT